MTTAHEPLNDSPARVFVVDDEEATRDGLAELLTRHGYVVTTARDGVEAVMLLPGSRAQVLIVDLGLPRLDGENLVRGLRGLPRANHLRVLVISARPDIARVAKSVGADDSLAKPFTPEDLLKRVERLTTRAFKAPPVAQMD